MIIVLTAVTSSPCRSSQPRHLTRRGSMRSGDSRVQMTGRATVEGRDNNVEADRDLRRPYEEIARSDIAVLEAERRRISPMAQK
jgi:hypothetical protein